MKKLSLVLASLLLAACAHTPAQEAQKAPAEGKRTLSVAHAKEVIVKGKTTQKDVLEKIGAPNSMQRRAVGQTTGAAQIWHYWTAPALEAAGKGGTHPIFRMTVSFDDEGVVQEYQAADGAVDIR